MLALKQKLELDTIPDLKAWARQQSFDAQAIDCMTAVMLKILDEKCQMNPATQRLFIDIYCAIEKKDSLIFDLAIHPFVEKVLNEPDALSLRHVHELRLFAESSIAKPVMKAFKQSFSFLMKGS